MLFFPELVFHKDLFFYLFYMQKLFHNIFNKIYIFLKSQLKIFLLNLPFINPNKKKAIAMSDIYLD